jgi:predicted DCC family thiol-disulfide oxidoreductase YuxK
VTRPAKSVLLFDRDCGFCRRAVGAVRSWDRNHSLRFVALQDPQADRFVGHLSAEERMRSWHLATPDGRLHSSGAVAAPLLRLLPGGRPLAAAVGSLPGVAELAYRFVARNRNRVGRVLGAACGVGGDDGAHAHGRRR